VFIQKFILTDKSTQLNSKKKNGLHPLRPRKGEIYLIDFGQNVGIELSNTHMCMQVPPFNKYLLSF